MGQISEIIIKEKDLSNQSFSPMPTDVVGENTVNKELQGTEMAEEMLSKIGMNHRTQERGEKYPRCVGIIEN